MMMINLIIENFIFSIIDMDEPIEKRVQVILEMFKDESSKEELKEIEKAVRSIMTGKGCRTVEERIKEAKILNKIIRKSLEEDDD